MPDNDLMDDVLRQPDDDKPVTRTELRSFARNIRSDLKWLAFVSIVGNQTLNHITLPTAAGVTGAIIVGVAFIIKLSIGSHAGK
jgi:hypothetical protein